MLRISDVQRLVPPNPVDQGGAEGVSERVELQEADPDTLAKACKTLGAKPGSYAMRVSTTKNHGFTPGYPTPIP